MSDSNAESAMDSFCNEPHTLIGNFAIHDDQTLCVEASASLIDASRRTDEVNAFRLTSLGETLDDV